MVFSTAPASSKARRSSRWRNIFAFLTMSYVGKVRRPPFSRKILLSVMTPPPRLFSRISQKLSSEKRAMTRRKTARGSSSSLKAGVR